VSSSLVKFLATEYRYCNFRSILCTVFVFNAMVHISYVWP